MHVGVERRMQNFLKAGGKDLGAWLRSERKASVVLPQEGDRRGIRVGLAANIQDGETDSVSGLEKHDWI